MNSKYTGKLVEDLLDKMSIIESGEVGGVISGKIFEKFLRKDQDDRTEHTLASDKLIEVGNFVSGTSGAIIYVDKATGHTVAELDKLYVRMKAYFELLEIINVNSVGGKLIISPAGGLRCSRVETYDSWGYYRCYFLTELDGEKIENRFIVGDLAYSKMFNAKEGTFNKISNRYYWRLVVGIGEDYIDLSKSDCDTDSDAPRENDVIVHRGNRNDIDRLNFIEFSSVDSYSPSITLYQGVNDYTLADKEVVQFGVEKSTGKAFMTVYGDMYIGNRDNTSYIKYSPETGVKIKGSLEIGTKLGDKDLLTAIDEASKSYEEDYRDLIDAINKDLENILKQIDGAIETWFYEPTPTLNNAPANTWTTDEMKNMHLGDLYYSGEGRAYRFLYDADSGKYYWNEIVDTDIKNALEAAKKAQDTADGKRKIFARLPTNADEYDIGDMWVNANYNGPDSDHTFNNDLVRAIVYKKAGDEFSILHWQLASKYTDDTVAKDALTKAEAALSAASTLLNLVGDFKDYVDGAFKDGIIDTSEAQAIEKYIKQLDTIKELVTQSYNEIIINSILENTKLYTDLLNSYNTFITSYNELITSIDNAIADGKTTDLEKAEVDGKYSNFNGKYGEYTKYLNAAIRYIEEAIDGKVDRAIEEIGGYSYLRKALLENTSITGGLILSSMLSLGYTNTAGEFLVMAGTNGLVVDKGERTIASWFGGGMIDMFDYYDSATKTFNVPEGTRAAAGLDRMDGTGYRAKGNLWWDKDGIVHADPLSFFVGEATVGGLLASFLVVMQDDGKHPLYIIPQVPFLSLLIADYILIGNAYLKYDSTNKAVYVTNADGTTDTVGFYAPWVSAKGANSSSSGGGSTSALYLLVDVVANDNNDGVLGALSGSVLMYNGTKWLAGTVVTDISTLTILTNGSTVATYNGKSNVTANISIPTIPTSLKNPYALTFGSNTYDGSEAKTITASDLGALTAHQTIYTLSIIGDSTTVSSFTPNSANNSITFVAGSNISITPDTTNKKITIANTYSYIHPTGGANTTITAANGRVLSAITVNSLGHTTSVSYKALAAADIPSLDWSKITTGKPTTLAGYGITDGVNSVTVNGTGNAVTTASISGHTITLTKGETFVPQSTFDDLFEKVNIGTESNPVYAIRAKYGFYSDEFISAKGINDSSSSGAGALYQLADVVPNATNDGVLNATSGSVLMYNGSKWQAGSVVSDISTLTLQVNGSNLATFNGKANVTANISVPTKLSQLTNDSGFITGINSSMVTSALGYTPYNSSNPNGYITISSVPTKLSQLTDDVVSGKYLPLSGGTIQTSSTPLPLSISALRMGNYCAIQFKNGSVDLGSLGFSAQNVPTFLNSSGTWSNLLHSGNYNSYAPTLTGTGASGTWGISITGNATTATNADMLDGYHAGFANGNIPINVSFPTYSQLVNLGYNTEANMISDYYYLMGILKWCIDNFASRGSYITLCGSVHPNSIGYCHIHLYSDSGKDSVTGLPKYCSGVYHNLVGTAIPFGTNNYVYYYGGSYEGSATKLQTARTIWGQSFDGTSSINGKLCIGKIAGQYNANRAELSVISTTNIPCDVILGSNNERRWSITARGSDESYYFGFYCYDYSSFTLCISPSGNVGIGTGISSLSHKLHVNGAVYGSSTATFASTVTAPTFSGSLSGNASTATALTSSAGSSAVPIYFSSGKPVQCSTTLGVSITGNAATATNADMLDGVHYQNILERTYSGAASSGNSTGWFRIAEAKLYDSVGISFILFIQRAYNYTNNEAYAFAISISFAGGINITQLSGYANNSLITKIRVDWKSSSTAYVDLYIVRSTTNNQYSWSTVGCATSYTSWTVNPTLIGTAYEFTTVNGCKSDRGFTGALTGNASSATKLQTARTIWGQSFDGTADVNGHLSIGKIFTQQITNRAELSLVSSSNTPCDLWLGSNGELKWSITARDSSESYALSFYNTTGTGHVMRILTNGNVGIGTTSPTVKLHVVGDIAATGAVTAKASSSDIRLKTDISDYKALSIIRNHRSIKYHWNEVAKSNADIFNDNDWHYGLIAQDLQKDLPQMVSDVFKDYLVINYERLIPICWKGLQEVDDEVTRLKKKVRKLEMEIRELKQKEDRV